MANIWGAKVKAKEMEYLPVENKHLKNHQNIGVGLGQFQYKLQIEEE